MPINSLRPGLAAAGLVALIGLAQPAHAAPDTTAETTVAQCVKKAETAQELRADGSIAEARAALEECARAECPAVVRRDCSQWAKELAQPTGAVILETVNEFGEPLTEVFVLLDGEEAPIKDGRIAVTPGTHVMRIEAENRIAVLKTIEVPEQTEVVVQATLLPIVDADADAFEVRSKVAAKSPAVESEPSAAPVWPWLAAGVGVLGAGSFAYFGLTGKAEADDLRELCGAENACSSEQVDAVQTKLTLADVSLGVGLVATGFAIWGFVSSSPSANEADDSASVRDPMAPILTGRGNSVVAQWQF